MQTTPAPAEILAAFSHEIRTPLSVVRGAIDLLSGDEESALTDDQRGFLELALRNIRRVESLVTGIIDSGRAGDGEWPIDPVPARLVRLVRSAVEEVREAFPDAAAVDVRADAGLSLVPADPDGIRRVVRNLICNAARLAPRGSRIAVRTLAIPTGQRVEVRDAGPGVAPEQREWIFGRFNGERRRGGIGLGLYLARRIAEAHGGTLRCVDPPGGRGACFQLDLPRRRVTRPCGPPAGQHWLTVECVTGRPLSPVQTFRIAEALRRLAPAARRIERRTRVEAILPHGCEEDQERLCGRLHASLGDGFVVAQHHGALAAEPA